MNPKIFFIDRVMPNAMLWGMAYVVLGKAVPLLIPSVAAFLGPIDWSSFLETRSLFLVIGAAAITIGLGWLVAQAGAGPLFVAIRQEVSSAIVNVCSIALFVGIWSVDVKMIVLAFLGYVIAWRVL